MFQSEGSPDGRLSCPRREPDQLRLDAVPYASHVFTGHLEETQHHGFKRYTRVISKSGGSQRDHVSGSGMDQRHYPHSGSKAIPTPSEDHRSALQKCTHLKAIEES